MCGLLCGYGALADIFLKEGPGVPTGTKEDKNAGNRGQLGTLTDKNRSSWETRFQHIVET